MCFENAYRLVVCQNGDFSLEIEQKLGKISKIKKKKKDFHGINKILRIL
ncbi:hypothetical protein HPCU_07745 [Helicobacter pylori Cuz20]|uniref:Uncharacterized protein n=1 Tax=Helicobacter pylori (strain Cuz20) TaxID=765964 RepID=A0AB32XA37_HELPC|nr:hypothetical protein HPCU_07745 [Helicobacter pylori Cuz20]